MVLMYVTEIWWFEINQTKERKFIDVEESTSRISTSPIFRQPHTHNQRLIENMFLVALAKFSTSWKNFADPQRII